MRMVVVFPAPFGPRKAKTSPRWTVNETSSTAVKSPNFLTTFSTRMIGCPLVVSIALPDWLEARKLAHPSPRNGVPPTLNAPWES
jgi:hypothetical protein